MDEPPSYSPLAFSSDSGLMYLLMAITVLSLGVCAFIAASENSFFTIPASQLKRLSQSKKLRERTVAEMLVDTLLVQATFRLLRTLVCTVYLVGSLFLLWYGTEMQDDPFLMLLVTAGTGSALTFFGVLLPRIYGRKNFAFWSPLTAPIWMTIIRFCRPLVSLLVKFRKGLEQRAVKREARIREAELAKVRELTAEKDEADDEVDLLKSVENFATLQVRQVMRQRSEIFSITSDLEFHAVIKEIQTTGYSRVPVNNKMFDRTEGVLYVKDLLPFLHQENSFPWQTLLRPVFTVSENKKIDQLLKEFQDKRVHLAIVVDSQGRTTGLITMENIIEVIIGDLTDEQGRQDKGFKNA